MNIESYETEKVVQIKGENGNLETLKNTISKLIKDGSSKMVTDLIASSETIHEMKLEEYEEYLFDEFGIRNEIRADDIKIMPDTRCLSVKISTNGKTDKFISEMCKKFKVNATIVVNGFNEDDGEPFELLTEITDCYSDGRCESKVMQFEEYLYRYDSGSFWRNLMDITFQNGVQNETYDEFISYFSFLNHNDIQFIQEKAGPFKE